MQHCSAFCIKQDTSALQVCYSSDAVGYKSTNITKTFQMYLVTCTSQTEMPILQILGS